MRAHEAFNRSGFSRLINSPGGRVFRIVAGMTFLAAGIRYRHRPRGIAAMAWSALPLSAGALDLCWISLALGGPASGAAIRGSARRAGRAGARAPAHPRSAVEESRAPQVVPGPGAV